MDLRFTPDERAFRQELRDFFLAEVPAETRRKVAEDRRLTRAEIVQARSMALYATMMAGSPQPLERRRAVSAAKALIGRNARRLGQEAVQLHGGIGVTLEHALAHHFKRLTVIDLLLGDADTHLAGVARLGGLIGERLEPT